MTSAIAAASLVGISVVVVLAGGDLVLWLTLRPRSTTSQFICAVPRHDEMGMRGRIVVAGS